jgi:hypothetical protein
MGSNPTLTRRHENLYPRSRLVAPTRSVLNARGSRHMTPLILNVNLYTRDAPVLSGILDVVLLQQVHLTWI